MYGMANIHQIQAIKCCLFVESFCMTARTRFWVFNDFASFALSALLLLQVELLLLLLSLKLLRSVSLAVFPVNYWKASGVAFHFLPPLFAVFYSVNFSGIRIFTFSPSLGPGCHALISASKCLLPLLFFLFTVGIFHTKGFGIHCHNEFLRALLHFLLVG